MDEQREASVMSKTQRFKCCAFFRKLICSLETPYFHSTDTENVKCPSCQTSSVVNMEIEWFCEGCGGVCPDENVNWVNGNPGCNKHFKFLEPAYLHAQERKVEA